jgi:outer membrane protein OmpA-like peptidoglycan-associated protein
LTACANQRTLVVVLPETNGHIGAVVVHEGRSRTVLDTAYGATTGSGEGRPLIPTPMDGPKVDRVFGEALAALPQPPVSLDLFFESDSLDLTPQSDADLHALLDTVKTRKAVEIVLTGHTDTMGTDSYNDALSAERAQSIKQKLLPVLQQYGVAADSVAAVGRGKRDPLIRTPDQTPEPRNRRVEITLR